MKKKLFFAAVLALVFVPNVNAEGHWGVDEDTFISFDFIFDYDEISIGQEIEFTFLLTNNTDYDFDFIETASVFDNTDISYGYGLYLSNGQSFVLAARESAEFVYNYTVPKDLGWYIKDGKYLADFAPNIYYYYGDTNIDYNNYTENPVTVPVNNLYDGYEYMEISFADDKELFKYADTMSSCCGDHTGEYWGEVFNYLNITNVSEQTMDINCIQNTRPPLVYTDSTYLVYSGETVVLPVFEQQTEYVEDIPQKELVDYDITFSFGEAKYYTVSIMKYMDTIVLRKPDVEVKPVEKGYEIKNISNETIHDFFVMYNIYDIEYLGGNQNDYINGDLAPGEVFYIDMDSGHKSIHVGYLIEGGITYWDISSESTIIHLKDYDAGEGFKIEYYPFIYNLEVDSITEKRTDPNDATDQDETEKDITDEQVIDDEYHDDNYATPDTNLFGDEDDDENRYRIVSMPLWILIVLGVVTVALGILLGWFVIRRKK